MASTGWICISLLDALGLLAVAGWSRTQRGFCTKYLLLIALVATRLPGLPVVCMEREKVSVCQKVIVFHTTYGWPQQSANEQSNRMEHCTSPAISSNQSVNTHFHLTTGDGQGISDRSVVLHDWGFSNRDVPSKLQHPLATGWGMFWLVTQEHINF